MADEPEFEPVADDATAAQPSTPGAKLRAAREAQGLSVQDIATRTRIAQRQLEASGTIMAPCRAFPMR